MRQNPRRTIWRVVGLIVLTAVFVFPLAWALLTSLKLRKDIFVYPPLVIFTPTLTNYRTVILNSDYLRFMGNSIMASFASALLSVAVGVLGSYAFSRFVVRGSRGILMWILSLRMIPPMAVVVPFYLMATRLGLYDTRVGLALVLTTVNLPIVVWLLLGYLRDIPVEIEEAALVDGCSRLRTLLVVTLPLAAPGIVATVILSVILAWNEFPLSLVLTSQTAVTLPVSMLSWDTQRGLLWGELMASSMMAIAPVVIFTAFVQRYLVRGLTLGAIVE